jgi:hypothetical protein
LPFEVLKIGSLQVKKLNAFYNKSSGGVVGTGTCIFSKHPLRESRILKQ